MFFIIEIFVYYCIYLHCFSVSCLHFPISNLVYNRENTQSIPNQSQELGSKSPTKQLSFSVILLHFDRPWECGLFPANLKYMFILRDQKKIPPYTHQFVDATSSFSGVMHFSVHLILESL